MESDCSLRSVASVAIYHVSKRSSISIYHLRIRLTSLFSLPLLTPSPANTDLNDSTHHVRLPARHDLEARIRLERDVPIRTLPILRSCSDEVRPGSPSPRFSCYHSSCPSLLYLHHTLATGYSSFRPLQGIRQHLCAFHCYADEPTRHVKAHHLCSHLSQLGGKKVNMHQCIIYDSNEPGARLIGIEYVVPGEVFRGL